MRKEFNDYLKLLGEVGYVHGVTNSLIYVDGLPTARLNERILFEDGQEGIVFSLTPERVEVIPLSSDQVIMGTRLTRTGNLLQVAVGDGYLGQIIDPMGRPYYGDKSLSGFKDHRVVDSDPGGFENREHVVTPFETGVGKVDLMVPMGAGQRQLVIGDRKTGKTQFLFQSALSQAMKDTIVVYAAIGKRQIDIKKLYEKFRDEKLVSKLVLVASASSDPAGLIYLTPYTAMTIAEYFRDQGKNVLVIMDDMTAHAKQYREITLTAKRFPGRNSYPGDIFYVHSKLLERAGNYKKASITCLPVVESVLGDLSGYIETNLMAMTDGHIFFDSEMYSEGARPAVNPFLSVTRVGLQAQVPLLRDISRTLTGFLSNLRDVRQFTQFGAELSQNVRKSMRLGDRLDLLFNQGLTKLVPVNINILVTGLLWVEVWGEMEIPDVEKKVNAYIEKYQKDSKYKKQVDDYVKAFNSFPEFVKKLRIDANKFR